MGSGNSDSGGFKPRLRDARLTASRWAVKIGEKGRGIHGGHRGPARGRAAARGSQGQYAVRTAPPGGAPTISDAYDIQDKYVALLRDRHGEAAGYKVGLTSAAMQKFCGIDHPIAGVVLASRVLRSGASVRRADFGRLGLEFEIAVRIKSDVPATRAPLTADAMRPHIGGVCAAIELVDDRGADYANLDVRSLVADNSWNGGIVLSELQTIWPDLERRARARHQRPRCDRRRPRPRHSRASLQFGRVARHALASRGEGLKAGQVVMTGSVMKTVFPNEDANYRFELGNWRCRGAGQIGKYGNISLGPLPIERCQELVRDRPPPVGIKP